MTSTDQASGSPRPVVAVMLPHGLDVRAWRRRYQRGDVLDETPYGYGQAAERFDLRWSIDHRETRLTRSVRRGIVHLIGADVVHVWRNRRLFDGVDAVWTHTEEEHLAVALLRSRLGTFRLLAQTIWLWDRWHRLTPPHRALLRRLVRRADLEVVLSRVNRAIGEREVHGRRIVRVPFGTVTAFGEPSSDAAPPRRLIFAPGNDRDRDWATFVAAARLLPDVEFLVASRDPWFTRHPELPDNVTRLPRMDRSGIAQAYSSAAVVAVPLSDNAHASGITVAIEALGRGCPVVASDVGGIDEYLDGSDGALVPAGDPAALAGALRRFVDAPHRSERNRALPVERGLTQRDYVRRIELATIALLGGGWDERIEQFTSTRA